MEMYAKISSHRTSCCHGMTQLQRFETDVRFTEHKALPCLTWGNDLCKYKKVTIHLFVLGMLFNYGSASHSRYSQ